MRNDRVCIVSVLCISWFFACSGGEGAGETGSGGTTATGGRDTGGIAPSGGDGGSSASAGATSIGGGGAADATGGVAGSGATITGGVSGSGARSTGGGGDGEPVRDAGWPDVVFVYDAGDAGTPDACASKTVTAEPVPLDLVIILDASLSMVEPGYSYQRVAQADCDIDEAPVKDSKWCRAINALMDFFEAPSSVGLGVAFRTFTGEAGGCDAYDSLDVDWGIIQGGSSDPLLQALETELNAQAPDSYTPTERALDTIVTYTLERRQANAQVGDENRQVIGILVTDGEPWNCDTNTSNLNGIVVNHYQATGIPTFFIGMDGAEYVGLNEMAANAGAEEHAEGCNAAVSPCYYYDVGQGDGSVLSDTLERIRQSVIGCQFAVPTTDLGLVDLETIDVQFIPGIGQDAETLPRVTGGEPGCGSSPGYFTDDDATPTTILLCPETCQRAEAEPTSSVSIELLCEGS